MYIHGTGDAWARMLVGSAMMFTSTFLYLVLIINDTLELSEIQKQNICHFTDIWSKNRIWAKSKYNLFVFSGLTTHNR